MQRMLAGISYRRLNIPGRRFAVLAAAHIIFGFANALLRLSGQGNVLILSRKTRLPYVACRVLTDTLSVLLCLLLGGVAGVGTLICAVGLGPIIAFFNRAVSRRLTGDD